MQVALLGRFLFFACLCISCAQRLSDGSLEVISYREDIVSRIASRAAELFQRRPFAVSNCQCSLHSCSFEFPGAECQQRLGSLDSLCGETCNGQLIDYNQSIIRTPPGIDPQDLSAELKESICTYRDLDALFFDLFPEAYAWTYFGTTDGHFRRWPASGRTHDESGDPLLEGCSSYDPRTRPWFISASTGPKDIIFIIDKSGSMLDAKPGHPMKWNTTTDALLAMIDTLGTSDYFNIVVFSDKAEPLWTQNSLAQGTNERKLLIKGLLNNQVPSGGTNFDAAFEMAFDLLTMACSVERTTCSKCEKVIIFLTDGKDTSRSLDGGIKPSEMAANIARYQEKLEDQTSRRASIFTFSMGTDADDSIPRQIACNNDGSWSFIRETDDPLTAMRSYYHFLTARRRSGSPIWTEPYTDDSGLGRITTVATPVFSEGTGDMNGVFLGVAGHDVFLSELGSRVHEQDIILNELVQRGSRCDPIITDPCQLQILRNVYANKATCIDRFPIPESEDDQPQCFTNGRSFYKRFSNLVDWEEAKERCEKDGGALVSIGSDEELAFVANMASDDGTWIGAKRNFDKFSWLDNTSQDLDYNSDSWGIGQPDSYDGVEDCVCIDTRGPTGNLNDAQCELQLTFICEYDSDENCKGKILDPRKEETQYFSTPPVELCVNSEASIAMTNTLTSSESLKSKDVVCDLGTPKDDSEFRCCSECVEELEKIRSPESNDNRIETLSNDVESEASDEDTDTGGGVSGTTVTAIAIAVTAIIVLLCLAAVLLHRTQNQQAVSPKDDDPLSPPNPLSPVSNYTSSDSAMPP